MAAPLPLEPGRFAGKTLGKYEVLSRLSTGGMSEIYLAFQRGLAGFQKLVVLKSILPDIKRDEEFVRMFVDEARMTASFIHPNIAQVYELDVDDGELFLAMEFVPGATLVEIARACRNSQQSIPLGLTLGSVRDSALALHYAHTFVDPLGRKQSVIHRDVAEKNIMITYEGTTKLLDFGIAKSAARFGRTQVGMVKGTSGYMSPEQIMGEPLDHRSDIFSLGVVLHECLTGMRLFYGPNPEDGMMATLKGDIAAPSRLNRQVSSALDAVCMKALSRRRDDRFSTALEFARELERVALPQFWKPEQMGEFVKSLFPERREQTRQLYEKARMQGDATGQFNLTSLLVKKGLQAPPKPLENEAAYTTPSGRRRVKETTEPDVDKRNVLRDDENYTVPIKEVPEDFRAAPVENTPKTPRSEKKSSPSPSTLQPEVGSEESGVTGFVQRIPKPARYTLLAVWLCLMWYLFFGFSFEKPKKNVATVTPKAEVVSAPEKVREEVKTPSRVVREPPKEEVEIPQDAPKAAPAPPPAPRVVETPRKITVPSIKPNRKPGKVSLKTEGGYADVYLGNRHLGVSPLYMVSLPAGKHTLRLVNQNQRTFTVSVDVPEGGVVELPNISVR